MRRSPLRHLDSALSELAAQGRLREREAPMLRCELAAVERGDRPQPERAARECLNMCSNDYLGYRHTGRLDAAAARATACAVAAGAGASRLVAGDHAEHHLLEGELARWLRCDAALVFTSGYAANLGTIGALVQPGDHVISDALNHASIIDGCRLGRARVTIVPHLDLRAVGRALEEVGTGRRWVITESYFSMDGDSPDLVALRALCDRADAAMVVDEAHALGVFGPEGRGRCAEAGVVPDVLIGTLGKCAAAQGAFVAGSAALCGWLWNRARSFVYSTGLSPLLAAIGLGAVRLVRADEAARVALRANVAALRFGLRRIGLVPGGEGPIVPLVLGSEARAMAWSAALKQRGLLVQAIRPPTVPVGGSRLRVTVRADWARADLERALSAFAEVAASEGTGLEL